MNIDKKVIYFVTDELKKEFSFIDIKSIRIISESNYYDDVFSITFAGNNGIIEENFKFQYVCHFIAYLGSVDELEYVIKYTLKKKILDEIKNNEEVINFERQYQSYLQHKKLQLDLYYSEDKPKKRFKI